VSDFDPTKLRLGADALRRRKALSEEIASERVLPEQTRRRRQHWVRWPWMWVERLEGASGHTWRVAAQLLYLHWKGAGRPVKLANAGLEMAGVSHDTKLRALRCLEQRGLVAVDWRQKKSPLVTVCT
jgi:hypothetical protein